MDYKCEAERPYTRRPDMSSFTSHLHQIRPETPAAAPTPVDVAALYRLVQDQVSTLAASAPTAENRALLERLYADLQASIDAPPERVPGVRQEYLDALDRVDKKRLRADDTCPICAEPHLDDPYALVVELPCAGAHRFDLECVGPWLLSKGNCPMCRQDLTAKKAPEPVPADDDEDNEDPDGMYG